VKRIIRLGNSRRLLFSGLLRAFVVCVGSSAALDAVAEMPQVSARTVEQSLQANLDKLTQTIQGSKRIEVVAFGIKEEKPITEPLCHRLLDALKAGKVSLPVPIARMSSDAEEEAYYRKVSAIARKYAPEQERRAGETQSSPQSAKKARKEFREKLAWEFMERAWYGNTERRLYANGKAADGRPRYLQLKFSVYPLDDDDHIEIEYIGKYDLSPDRGFGYSNRYGSGDGLGDDYAAFGVLAFEGKTMPWQLLRPTRLQLPVEWENESWPFVATIETDLGSIEYTFMTCSYPIK